MDGRNSDYTSSTPNSQETTHVKSLWMLDVFGFNFEGLTTPLNEVGGGTKL